MTYDDYMKAKESEAEFIVETEEQSLRTPLARPERALDFLAAGWRKTAEAEACFAAAYSAWDKVLSDEMHRMIMDALRLVDKNLDCWKADRFEDLKKALETGQLP